MPRRSTRTKAQAPAKRNPRAALSRSAQKPDNVPDQFRELLAEAEGDAQDEAPARPLKRRRVVEQPPFDEAIRPDILPSDLDTGSEFENALRKSALQTVTRDFDSSSDSDMEFEDVALVSESAAAPAEAREVQNVTITLGRDSRPTPRRTPTKKRAITAAEKQTRLDVHKIYICCLLYHNFVRNSYCNDHVAQTTLRALLTEKVKKMLKPRADYPQTRRTALFMDGLNAVNELWKTEWRITHRGIQRPHWASSTEDLKSFKLSEQVEVSLDRKDFRRAAKKREGSADLGAQVLCALLRSAGVVTRLACSIQPLTFAATNTGSTPRKAPPQKRTICIDESDDEGTKTDDTTKTANSAISIAAPGSSAGPRRIARLGGPRVTADAMPDFGRAPPIVASNTRRVSRPSYPVYWVEAFDEARQKWVAIDSLATQTVSTPSRLEPPFNDSVNAMTYVIAFDNDGFAKDVTRRYTRAFNAKTRKLRVDSDEDGARWLRKALRLFRKRPSTDRDSIEDAELARREAAEGMPRNVQDFKNHPYYVLERHLRHNEIIHPMTEVGKVNSGGAANGKLESVYRRRDVHVVRSADKWYRYGREIKAGEQPMKHGKPRRQGRATTDEQDQEEDEAGIALYAISQTEMYVPPPVVRGKIPRNAFGNLDVYVPSMVPLGAVHIRSRHAAKAARSLRIDYADAVTGFKFQGRKGTAVVEGVVVADEHAEAMQEFITGYEDDLQKKSANKRSAELLRLWRRFIIGLRVAERLQEYEPNGEGSAACGEPDIQDEIDRDEAANEVLEEGGGFFVDEDDTEVPDPMMGMHTGAIAEAIPYEDIGVHDYAAPVGQPSFLPQGAEFVGFEGVELKSTNKPPRRLLDLEDSDDESRLPHSNRRIDASKPASATRFPELSQTGSVAPFELGDGGIYGGGFLLDDDVSAKGTASASPESVDHNHQGPEAPRSAGNEDQPRVHIDDEKDLEYGSSEDCHPMHSNSLHVEDEDVDKGSLLSYDPDDEDAEPEWLDT